MKNKRKGYVSKQVDMKRLSLMLDMEVPKTKIAKALDISRMTLYRIIEENKL